MHDSLNYVAKDPLYRSHHHGQMTFSLVYAFTENYVLPISHDEVVHGKGSLLRKMPGDRWQQLANLRAYLAYMWAHPGKQLLFMGCEFGQESEWAESRELDWWLLEHPEHAGVHAHGARHERGLHRVGRAVGPGQRPRRASSGSTPTTPAATSSRSYAAPPASPTWSAWPTSPAIPHEGYRLGLPVGRHLVGGPQHRRRGLHRLGRGQPRRRSPPPGASTTASRRTPTSWCRPWRRCGSARRADGLLTTSGGSSPASPSGRAACRPSWGRGRST